MSIQPVEGGNRDFAAQVRKGIPRRPGDDFHPWILAETVSRLCCEGGILLDRGAVAEGLGQEQCAVALEGARLDSDRALGVGRRPFEQPRGNAEMEQSQGARPPHLPGARRGAASSRAYKTTCGSLVGTTAQECREQVEQRTLACDETPPRQLHVAPFDPVDLGELRELSRPWWPLHREHAGHDRVRVQVTLARPHRQPLARRLLQLAQRHERVGRHRQGQSELFLPLAHGRIARLLAVDVLAFRHRPGGIVLAGPERSAHVRDEDLQLAVATPPQQDSRAAHRHGLQSGVRRISPAEFVLAHTHVRRPPFVPEVQLHLADDSVALWEETQVAIDHGQVPPPFWAFVWAGGQAVARYLLDFPDVVGDREVVDVATGSGLVAIAASVSGAAHVRATDVDELAVAATRLNATLNDVALEAAAVDVRDLVVTPGTLVTVGDVFYDEKIAALMLPELSRLVKAGANVLVGDPHRAYLPRDALEVVAEYDV